MGVVVLCGSLLWGCAEKDIVTLGPGMTEIVFALGEGDRVAATDSASHYPLEVESLPKLGPATSPDLEQLDTVAPAHVFLGETAPSLIPYCQENGIQLHLHTVHSLDDLLQSIQDIGRTLSKSSKANVLCRTIQAEFDQMQASVEAFDKPTVFISIRRRRGEVAHLSTVNGHTLISDLVHRSGGENIFADANTHAVTVSIDELREKKPDVILEIIPEQSLTRSQQVEYYQDWIAYKDIPAVNTARVHFITMPYTLLPSPRVIRTGRTLVKHLHPESLY